MYIRVLVACTNATILAVLECHFRATVDTKQILTFLPAKTSETKPIRVFFMCPPPIEANTKKTAPGV